MKRIMLYFGSFNPVHRGHTAIARWVVERGLCDGLWFVVSPQNPFKDSDALAPEVDRLEMARIAVAEMECGGRVVVSDVETRLPKPSYTIDTLRHLGAKYPATRFSLLLGEDNLEGLSGWKEHEKIVGHYPIFVYPREGQGEGDAKGYDYDEEAGGFCRREECRFMLLDDAPRLDLSSTEIRRRIAAGQDIKGMVSPGVERYIAQHGLYLTVEQKSSAERIGQLTAEIERSPSADLYLERGKTYHRSGAFGKALNDFLRARQLDPSNAEATQWVSMLREIFEFRHLDNYNP